MLARNTILQNRYRIIRPLGKGGMGQVYEAMDDTVDSIVVIKETFAATDRLRAAFAREAKLLANLKHSSLPRVTHYFQEDGGQFLVMEFIGGLNLAELLKLRGRPFGPEEVLPWVDRLLDALAYLHGQPEPVIHRDIKPANIKVTDEWEVYLLDFGLAKGAPGQETSSVHGYTAAYAPLEQITNSGTNAQSDLYSLGATFYHLLTGHLPALASKRYDAIEDGSADPLSPAAELNREVPESISAIISRAMAMKRRERFASANEMRAALREASLALKREREQKILDTPTLPMENARALPAPTEPAPELVHQHKGDQGIGGQKATPEEAYLKTIPAKPPVVPQPPPIDPTQPSWPSQIDSEPSPSGEGSVEEKERAHRKTTKPTPLEPTFWNRRRAVIAVILVVASCAIGILLWQWSGSNSEIGGQRPPQQAAETKSPVTPTIPAGMVYVPGGEFSMGRDDGDEYERPAHKVTVGPFFIDRYEVTREEYAKFLRATGHRAPAGWVNGDYPAGTAHKPVTGVTWDDAMAYAKWAGKRLPTEEEWEFAARGTDGRLYPWGKVWQPGMANAGGASGGIADVGTYKGASPFGALDMAGNVWEWTASQLKAYPGSNLPAQKPLDSRVIRGGAFKSEPGEATSTFRLNWPTRQASTYQETGFRCARDAGQ